MASKLRLFKIASSRDSESNGRCADTEKYTRKNPLIINTIAVGIVALLIGGVFYVCFK